MSKYLLHILLLCACLWLGNYQGDFATLRDCAATGKAEMLSGGAIRCEVIRKDTP